MTTAGLALIVSGFALLTSLVSLWLNSLKPFELKLSHDTPTFRLYKITPQISGDKERKSWWIPSFDIGLSFYNLGKKPGEVLDIRIIGDLASHRTHRKFVFYPKWIVDYAEFNQSRGERFEWLKTAILREWYPSTLGANDQKDLHAILESDRWDHKESGEMTLTLQIVSSSDMQWQTCAEYKLLITEDMFDDRSSYTPYDEKIERLRKIDH